MSIDFKTANSDNKCSYHYVKFCIRELQMPEFEKTLEFDNSF